MKDGEEERWSRRKMEKKKDGEEKDLEERWRKVEKKCKKNITIERESRKKGDEMI